MVFETWVFLGSTSHETPTPCSFPQDVLSRPASAMFSRSERCLCPIFFHPYGRIVKTYPSARLEVALRTKAVSWLAFVVALAIFSPSLRSEFIRDDPWQIVKNQQIQSWDYLPRLFSTHLWSQAGTEYAVHFYRPLFSVWMLVVNTFGGLSSVWWHFCSMLLHALTTLLVYRLCEKFLESRVAALLAALLFAVHPIHVDAVSWVSASNEILFTAFALGAILVLVAPEVSSSRIASSAALYAAALLTKETAIAVMPVLLLVVLFRGKRRSVVRAGVWYLSVTAGYFIVRWWALHRIGTEESKHTWREMLLTSPSVLVFYLKKLFFPVHLSGFYVNPILSAWPLTTPG